MSTPAHADSSVDHHQDNSNLPPSPPPHPIQGGAGYAGPTTRVHIPPQRRVSERMSLRPTTPELQERLEREFTSHLPTLPTTAMLRASSSLEKSASAFMDEAKEEFTGAAEKKIGGVFRKFFSTGGDDPGYSAPKLTRRDTSGIRKTVAERIQDTREHAAFERNKFARQANLYTILANLAIGLQVVISALITGLAAVVSPKRSQVMTSILGGLGTVVAAYVARSRVSGEPELSQKRVKELEKFIRNCESLIDDHGNDNTDKYDEHIFHLRDEFEKLLGNLSNTGPGSPGTVGGPGAPGAGGPGAQAPGGVGTALPPGNANLKGEKLLPV